MIPKLHIFTIASNQNHHLNRLLASAKKHKINIHVLGMGEPYLGHGTKRVAITNALKKHDPNDLFLFVDAYDVIFLTNEEEIIEKYNQYYPNKLVYGAEHNFGMYSFDDIYYYWKYPIKRKGYRFLNSGTIMGKVGHACRVFESIGLAKTNKSDQMDAIRYFTSHPSEIVVDQDQHLFAVNGGRAGLEDEDYTVTNDRLFAKRTNNWPILFHVPGKFFIGLDKIAHALGFMDTIPTYTNKELKWYKSNKRDHLICDRLGIDNYKYRLIKNWTVNIIIILLIIFIIRWSFGV